VQLTQALRQFAADRKCGRFHSPKNLAMALSVEVAALVEIFQCRAETELRAASDKIGAALEAHVRQW
jgi:hypothetical protein